MEDFDFNQAAEEAATEAAADKWDKARLYHERVVFCIRTIEEGDNPFFDATKDNSPPTIFQMVIGFVWDGRKNSIQQTYRVTPEMRILVRNHPRPWHNMTFARYQTKTGSYGYELKQVTKDSSACLWERAHVQAGSVRVAAPAPLQIEPGNVVEAMTTAVHAATTDAEQIDAILTGMGFEPSGPATDAQKRQILAYTASLKANSGIAVNPGNLDEMNEAEAALLLAELEPQMQAQRQRWIQASVGKAKSTL